MSKLSLLLMLGLLVGCDTNPPETETTPVEVTVVNDQFIVAGIHFKKVAIVKGDPDGVRERTVWEVTTAENRHYIAVDGLGSFITN